MGRRFFINKPVKSSQLMFEKKRWPSLLFRGALGVRGGGAGRWRFGLWGEGRRREGRQSRVGWLGAYRVTLRSGCGDWPLKTPVIEPHPPTALGGFGLGFLVAR